MSMSWQSGGEAPPALLVLPPAAASLDEAHLAIEQWEHYSGKVLDPPQRLAVEVMMAESSSGRWAARTTGREMPRQNGKGDELEVVEFWGLTQRGEAILHTAHELNTVSSAHQRMVGLLQHRDFRGRRQPKVLNGLGQQSIAMGDAVVQYRTRTAGGGRGLDDISRLVVDEAQHARPEQLASATPTLLANPNPQMNFAGTGGISGVSEWWWSLRIRALGAAPGDFGYVGHTAERLALDPDGTVVQEPVDPTDRALWLAANPALVFGRTEMAFLEEQLLLLGPALFAREHLGVWDPPPVHARAGLPLEAWARRFAPGAVRGEARAHTLDVSPDGASAAVGASDGLNVAVVEHGPGTSWVVPKLSALGIGRVWLDPKAPAGALIQQIEAAGIAVERVTAEQHAQACGAFLAAVVFDPGPGEAPKVQHSDQPVLNDAVAAASRRPYGQAWAWDRIKASGDICPLVAVTIALWAAGMAPAPTVGFVDLGEYLDEEW